MADFSALTRGFQQGADWRQQFRANKQLEQRRAQLNKLGQIDLDAIEGNRADLQELYPEDTEGLGGSDMSQFDLQDPFAQRMWSKFQNWRQGRRRSALPGAVPGAAPGVVSATPGPTEVTQEIEPDGYAADGGLLEQGGRYADGPRGRADRVTPEERLRQNPRPSAPKPPPAAAPAAGAATAAKKTGLARRALNSKVGRGLGALAATGAIVDQLGQDEEGRYAAERFDDRFGWNTPDVPVGGYEGDPGEASLGGFAKFFGKQLLGFASDLGDKVTGGIADKFYRDERNNVRTEPTAQAPAAVEPLLPAQEQQQAESGWTASTSAPQRTALPQPAEQEPLDFSQMKISARDVPDMKTTDWQDYRRMVIRDAARRGQPIDQLQDRITAMQQKGFMNYALQGFAHQRAGNPEAATAAYRAAFQYFPNGHDVEFGIMPGRNGELIIVGVGLDEKTGQRVPGSEMVMTPETVTGIIENLQKPGAWNAWAKDQRDANFRERQYNEVTRPLAQAQADNYANSAMADVIRAENASGGGLEGADRRAAEESFRRAVERIAMQDGDPEQLMGQADYLASVMSQLKIASPQTPDNTIIETVLRAHREGTLEQRLRAMTGGGTAPTAPTRPAAPTQAPRRALPPPTSAAPSAGRPAGIPDAVWNNAVRDNGGSTARAAAALSQYNQYQP